MVGALSFQARTIERIEFKRSLTESIQETRIVHLPPGTRIDNFIVGQLLGEGEFGAVYEVTSMDGRVKHALKIEATNAVPLHGGTAASHI